jgi:hypothetical protein
VWRGWGVDRKIFSSLFVVVVSDSVGRVDSWNSEIGLEESVREGGGAEAVGTEIFASLFGFVGADSARRAGDSGRLFGEGGSVEGALYESSARRGEGVDQRSAGEEQGRRGAREEGPGNGGLAGAEGVPSQLGAHSERGSGGCASNHPQRVLLLVHACRGRHARRHQIGISGIISG